MIKSIMAIAVFLTTLNLQPVTITCIFCGEKFYDGLVIAFLKNLFHSCIGNR